MVYDEASEDNNPNLLSNLSKEQVGNFYKMVSSSGDQYFFVKSEVATTIVNKMEYPSLNKMKKSIDGQMIKEFCWKLETNRLGKITKIYK